MTEGNLVLDYPSATPTDQQPPQWTVVVRRTLGGLFGLAMLLVGAAFTVSTIVTIPQIISYHVSHYRDMDRFADLGVALTILLLAFFCDWMAVRWLGFALRGDRRVISRKWR